MHKLFTDLYILGSAYTSVNNIQRNFATSQLVHNNNINPNAVPNNAASINLIPKLYPQPVPASHPHILKSGEVLYKKLY